MEGGVEPPENPDPKRILEEARADKQADRYEESLAKFLWFHQFALMYCPSLCGVRLSFALSDWRELGDVFPEALQSMVDLRDQLGREIDTASLQDIRSLFREFDAFNKKLGERARSISKFFKLGKKDSELARAVFQTVQPALIDVKAFALCLKYIDIRATISHQFMMLRECMTPGSALSQMSKSIAWQVKREIRQLVELLVQAGQVAEAKEVVTNASKELVDADFHFALECALKGE